MHVVGYANPNPIELFMFIRLAALFVASNLVFGSLACSSCVWPLRCDTKKFIGTYQDWETAENMCLQENNK